MPWLDCSFALLSLWLSAQPHTHTHSAEWAMALHRINLLDHADCSTGLKNTSNSKLHTDSYHCMSKQAHLVAATVTINIVLNFTAVKKHRDCEIDNLSSDRDKMLPAL